MRKPELQRAPIAEFSEEDFERPCTKSYAGASSS